MIVNMVYQKIMIQIWKITYKLDAKNPSKMSQVWLCDCEVDFYFVLIAWQSAVNHNFFRPVFPFVSNNVHWLTTT